MILKGSFTNIKQAAVAKAVLTVDSVHDDPLFWDVAPPAKQAIRVRA